MLAGNAINTIKISQAIPDRGGREDVGGVGAGAGLHRFHRGVLRQRNGQEPEG